MPYVHKAKASLTIPELDQTVKLGPARAYDDLDFAQEDRIYLFREDREPGDGCLVARGRILSAVETEKRRWTIEAKFDGQMTKIPLHSRALEHFMKKGSDDIGPFALPVMTEVAELRRNTTHQPVHEISPAAADWLDFYHFQAVWT